MKVKVINKTEVNTKDKTGDEVNIVLKSALMVMVFFYTKVKFKVKRYVWQRSGLRLMLRLKLRTR